MSAVLPRSERASVLRRSATFGAVVLASVGLSACRTVPERAADKAERAEAARAAAATAPGRSSELPAESVSRTTPAGSTPTATPRTTSAAAASPTPSGEEAPVDGTTPPGIAELEAAAAADEREAGEAPAPDESASGAEAQAEGGDVLGTTPDAEAPKPVDPWRLVGQPYLVDDESPQSAPDGTTSFTLWFRTAGDFRGVRAGTSVTDDRHFKVGLITVPELPGYVPGGIGMLQRSERMLQKGRYCWTAEVHRQGKRGDRRFVLRRNGAPLQVEFDLRGAPLQRRTATVLVRSTTGDAPPPTPVERALACR